MTYRWITIEAERVLYVHRGRDVILCDRDHPGPVTLVVKLTNEEMQKLKDDDSSRGRGEG